MCRHALWISTFVEAPQTLLCQKPDEDWHGLHILPFLLLHMAFTYVFFFDVWICLPRLDVGQLWKAQPLWALALNCAACCPVLSKPSSFESKAPGALCALPSHFFYSTIQQFDTHSGKPTFLTDMWPWLSPLWCFLGRLAAAGVVNIWIDRWMFGWRKAGVDGQMIEPSAFMGGIGAHWLVTPWRHLSRSAVESLCCPLWFTPGVICLVRRIWWIKK